MPKMPSQNGETMKYPLQPIYSDHNGTLRFRSNPIVKFLLESGPFDMNTLATMPFDKTDKEQFAQLIGYSTSGFCDLSYVSKKTKKAVEQAEQDVLD